MTLFRDSIVAGVSMICIDSNEGNETNMTFHINQINEADFRSLGPKPCRNYDLDSLCIFNIYLQTVKRNKKESKSSPGCSQIKKIMQLEDCHITGMLLCQQLLCC